MSFRPRLLLGAANAVLAAFALILTAGIARQILEPVEASAARSIPGEPAGPGRELAVVHDRGYYSPIVERDVFNAPKPLEVVPPAPPPPVLSGRLLGTAVSRTGGRSFAVVEVPGVSQLLLAAGDELQGRVVAEIDEISVSFLSGDGRRERLEIPLAGRKLRAALRSGGEDDGTPAYVESALPVVDPGAWAAAGNPALALASIQPVLRNGELQGFSVSAILPNSPYDRIGMKNGDLVTKIAGSVPPNPLAGVLALEKIREDAPPTLTIVRRGAVIEIGGKSAARTAG